MVYVPGIKFRSLRFKSALPKGLEYLRFNRPWYSPFTLVPIPVGNRRRQLYVDTNWQLFVGNSGMGNSQYKPVLLRYDPHAKSVFARFYHYLHIFRLCLEDGPKGAKLSLTCSRKYNLVLVKKVSAFLYHAILFRHGNSSFSAASYSSIFQKGTSYFAKLPN